ncbi:hypothetical protein DFP72DRAFT_891291 [Ephemerocybe angulata]|uniref:Rho termination factor N-terminal domain-containing protein n=1 Tax=Ephemerocybe angulata TaxID=980116 RepID=A0A8H6I2H8_9AGAR|nr:hypothetical protein DFP72DRAFT_891291 [Tulosesus angulatus]
MDLRKLTVPQLKAICKDKKLTGYSKLNKSALLAKLQHFSQPTAENGDTQGPTTFIPQITTANVTTSIQDTSNTSKLGPSSQNAPPDVEGARAAPLQPFKSVVPANTQDFVPNSRQDLPESQRDFFTSRLTGPAAHTSKQQHPTSIQVTPGTSEPPEPASLPSRTVTPQPSQAASLVSAVGTMKKTKDCVKRKLCTTAEKPNPKRAKLQHKATLSTATPQTKVARNLLVPLVATLEEPQASRQQQSQQTAPFPDTQIRVHALSTAPRTLKKAFAPLIPKVPPRTSNPKASTRTTLLKTPMLRPDAPVFTRTHLTGTSDTGLGDDCLDSCFRLPAAHSDAAVSLKLVTFPPGLSKRKRVQWLAPVLSCLYERDIQVFSGLSKLHRYSARIAASYILQRQFPGLRLKAMLKRYSPNMYDFWPYLALRRLQLRERKAHFYETFLGKALKAYPSIVSDQMWACEDERAVLIAVKFLLTSYFYRVSIGLDLPFGQMSVTYSEEIIPGEIWRVTLQIGSSVCFYYVLEATCEVVGLPMISTHQSSENPDRTNSLVRADWTRYIDEKRHRADAAHSKALEDHLSWPNHEEYDRGISRNWLNRLNDDGPAGVVKLIVAQRYVLACLVANSLSGREMTSAEMEQEFNGRLEIAAMAPSRVKRQSNLNLFLPSHHLIESVHLKSKYNLPFHLAIAGVQTPGREYYILRDNGLQIGCEEDGVAPVWMDIIGCDSNGIACG